MTGEPRILHGIFTDCLKTEDSNLHILSPGYLFLTLTLVKTLLLPFTQMILQISERVPDKDKRYPLQPLVRRASFLLSFSTHSFPVLLPP
jgi:hypothetical protein